MNNFSSIVLIAVLSGCLSVGLACSSSPAAPATTVSASETASLPEHAAAPTPTAREAEFLASGPIVVWTVMQKLDDGSAPATLDWQWQKVDSHRNTVNTDINKCVSCHTTCTPTGSRGGYAYTCTMPP